MKEPVILDVECYKNYFLAMFRKVSSGQIIYYEKFNDSELDTKSLRHVMNKYQIITFNGNKYDQLIVEAALAGFDNYTLYRVSKSIIPDQVKGQPEIRGLQPWQVRKQFGFRQLEHIDHIDIFEVLPIRASLKIYGGRIHAPKMQDLPIHHNAEIKETDLVGMRSYCGNDLELTELLFKKLKNELELRTVMSEEYGVDVRSKSDAQIAEAVISHEFQKHEGFKPKKQSISSGTKYKFNPPAYIKFDTELLQNLFRQYCENECTVLKSGHVELLFDDDKKKSQFVIGQTKYTAGVGGLHSVEKGMMHVADKDTIIREYDAAAFYPNIIIINKLAPKSLGKAFLRIYASIVNRRLKAKALEKKYKKSGDKVNEIIQHAINESLKITINGSFGKLASKYSFLYAPDLMMHVTVIGQLSLLMIIEQLELNGVSVISANTDGIVVKMKRNQEEIVASLISDWEFETGYEMEGNDYLKLCSRDVNNYIAIKGLKSLDEIKGKGAFTTPNLKKNPSTDICALAAKEFLQKGIPIKKTIRECEDITKFIKIQTVNGGAQMNGEVLGKAIRWYYGKEELDAIYYVTNGNKVGKSDGAVPCMELPDELPEDIDYDWYIDTTKAILKGVGHKI